MKKVATAIAAIALIGTPAFAADMPMKAPAPASVPVPSWTGWYLGGNLGASFGSAKTDFSVGPTVSNITIPSAAFPGFTTSDQVYPSGFIGGGQVGYNWQLSPSWVVGLEADFQGADEKEGSTFTNTFFDALTLSGATRVTNYEAKIEWFGTARLRAGYVWGDGQVLSYVTGGLAYGKVDIEGTSTVSGNAFVVGFSVPPQAFDHSNVDTGWVVGTGTEGKLLIPGWTYKIEGLYMDLGHLDTTGPGGSISPFIGVPSATVTVGPVHTHTHFTDTILRAGLNYQFH